MGTGGSASKAKGSEHERQVCRYLNAHGFPHAERMPAGAPLDRGDLAAVVDRDGDRWTVEVKRQRDQSNGNIASWCREAAAEAVNGGTGFWLVVGKRWGSAAAGDSPVWLPITDLAVICTGDTGYHRSRTGQAQTTLADDPDAGLLDTVAQITLRTWCALTSQAEVAA